MMKQETVYVDVWFDDIYETEMSDKELRVIKTKEAENGKFEW